jgi:hypothetical protein
MNSSLAIADSFPKAELSKLVFNSITHLSNLSRKRDVSSNPRTVFALNLNNNYPRHRRGNPLVIYETISNRKPSPSWRRWRAALSGVTDKGFAEGDIVSAILIFEGTSKIKPLISHLTVTASPRGRSLFLPLGFINHNGIAKAPFVRELSPTATEGFPNQSFPNKQYLRRTMQCGKPSVTRLKPRATFLTKEGFAL